MDDKNSVREELKELDLETSDLRLLDNYDKIFLFIYIFIFGFGIILTFLAI